jgi:hypothetical protein
LKQSDLISHLALYDIVNAAGVAADLSHINTASKVTGHVGKDALAEALQGAHTVVIPAGVPRKPGMTRDDLFKVNNNSTNGMWHSENRKKDTVYCPRNLVNTRRVKQYTSHTSGHQDTPDFFVSFLFPRPLNCLPDTFRFLSKYNKYG